MAQRREPARSGIAAARESCSPPWGCQAFFEETVVPCDHINQLALDAPGLKGFVDLAELLAAGALRQNELVLRMRNLGNLGSSSCSS